MKSLSILTLFALSILTGRAGATNTAPVSVSQSLTTELPKSVPTVTITPVEPKPNQMTIGRTEASGILVEAVKTRSFLKLLNPFSPPTNSTVEDNVTRDISTGKVTGIKFFAVRF